MIKRKSVRNHILIGGSLLILSACNLNQASNPLPDPSFREARFQQMQKLQTFRDCRDHALQLDKQAGSHGSAARFLTSATVTQKCVTDLGPAANIISADERMRLQALSVINYFRGGNVEMARRHFQKFKTNWPEHDLYLSEGTSFMATAEALLGGTEDKTFGQFMALNVADEVKAEMRRLAHWKNK